MSSWAMAAAAILWSTTGLAQPAPPQGATPPALDYTLRRPPKEPLSARLLQVQYAAGTFGNPFAVQQGYAKVPGSELARLVAGSHEATTLAVQANEKFDLASGLLIGALACDVGALGTAIAAAATAPQNFNNQVSTTGVVLVGVSLGLLVVGLGLAIGGGIVMRDAIDRWLEAVNTYNRQLVDGRLDAVPSS